MKNLMQIYISTNLAGRLVWFGSFYLQDLFKMPGESLSEAYKRKPKQ